MIVDQQTVGYDKLESRGAPNKNGAGGSLCYGGHPLTVGALQGFSGANHAGRRQEIFVSSMGETGANELKFFNLTGDSREHQSLKKVELTIDGCTYLSAHSKTHCTLLMASNNGSVFAWTARPARIIQPLAPDFHEIERNIWYVEREDEFEEELSDSEEKQLLEHLEQKSKRLGLAPLDERQRKLAQ